jgi:predicted GNAT family acetyltransferase
MPEVDVEVRDNLEKHRFDAVVDGRLAGFAEYHVEDGAAVFTHTQVADAYEGKGVGSRLVRGALDQVHARGLAVVPECPFFRAYLQRHPELVALVPAARRAEFGLQHST